MFLEIQHIRKRAKKVLGTLEGYNLNAYLLLGSEESLMETLATRELLLRPKTSDCN